MAVCESDCTINETKNQEDDYAVYNRSLAVTLAHYASAVYISDLMGLFNWTCSRCIKTNGFVMIDLIVDVDNCLQAFVGFAKSLNAVIIAFRGTQLKSIQNWMTDLNWCLSDLDYPDSSEAKVHHGFYSAYHDTSMRPAVVKAVRKANLMYGANINVFVTGHSMGGAMASFCALDLKMTGLAKNIQVCTYGMPRIGNAEFATFYSQHVPDTIRVTSERDIVPHLPPNYPTHYRNYRHFPREVWIHKVENDCSVNIIETVCDESGEDPCCSRSLIRYSLFNHMYYYGLSMADHHPKVCHIVIDPGLDNFTTSDSYGNFIFSRTPTNI
ncbi:lipase-like [Impatiens glandulifera]|uniref:lipase-like n=1 Tax=Impatiens glandulifera TaxID=253017 RepID=UPI001FB0D363|nr:lipase-like [Impatiens glandulifera]